MEGVFRALGRRLTSDGNWLSGGRYWRIINGHFYVLRVITGLCGNLLIIIPNKTGS